MENSWIDHKETEEDLVFILMDWNGCWLWLINILMKGGGKENSR